MGGQTRFPIVYLWKSNDGLNGEVRQLKDGGLS
jgi:hypothetical protein